LEVLIGTCAVLGLLALGLAFFLTPRSGATQTASGQAAPAAQAQPTAAQAAPAAQAQPTAAQAPAAQAPAAGGIPTEAQGPAVASGTAAEQLEEGTDVAQLAFRNKALTAPADSLVTLTFNNEAAAVQHNWVLVDGGDDVANAVNTAAQSQVTRQTGASAAVPPADTPGLLVAVPLINPGESYTVTFQTPGPGTYEFICTFPGHYNAGMVGELTVQ